MDGVHTNRVQSFPGELNLGGKEEVKRDWKDKLIVYDRPTDGTHSHRKKCFPIMMEEYTMQKRRNV